MPRANRCQEIHFAWQAQYLVKLECDFSWQAQHLVTFWEIAGARNVVHSVRLTCRGVRKVLLLTYTHSTRHSPGEPMHRHFLLIAQNAANILRGALVS